MTFHEIRMKCQNLFYGKIRNTVNLSSALVAQIVTKVKCCKYASKSFVCVEVLRPSQPNGVMSSAVSLPSHTFTGQA